MRVKSLGNVPLDSPANGRALLVDLQNTSVINTVVFDSEGLAVGVARLDSPLIGSAS